VKKYLMTLVIAYVSCALEGKTCLGTKQTSKSRANEAELVVDRNNSAALALEFIELK
jgi:hypothetical protein